jgi:hypothetical protein
MPDHARAQGTSKFMAVQFEPAPSLTRKIRTASLMATYQMVYGEDDEVVTETYENVDDVEREDGWVVLFRGPEAIIRVQEAHVRSLERLDA